MAGVGGDSDILAKLSSAGVTPLPMPMGSEARTPFSQIPAQCDPFLDSIRFWPDGRLLLCSSSLVTRYWRGSAWLFAEPQDAPDVNRCITGVEVDSGIADSVVLNAKQFIVGLDSGCVQLMELVGEEGGDGPPSVSTTAEALDHDEAVLSLGLVKGGQQLISGSADKSVKLWDIDALAPISSYPMAHWQAVTNVSCHPQEPEVFATCGEDGRALMWDARLPKPATELESMVPEEGCATAITWSPNTMWQVAIGDQRGCIRLRDIRQHNHTVHDLKPFNRLVFRLEFNPHDSNLLAACADHTCVQVVDFNHPNAVRYSNDNHTDFVRGLAWHPQQRHVLYTSGWDKRVLRHYVGERTPNNQDISLMDTNGIKES